MLDAPLVERLQAQFPGAVTGSNPTAIQPWLEVAPQRLSEIARFLRDELGLNFLACITAVDYLETDPKKVAKTTWKPHLELVYHLRRVPGNEPFVLKVKLPRWHNDELGQLPRIASVASLWRTADWHEREVYDLSGVFFEGHPDLRRILCPEDWVGHPLRKDYVQPLEYHGIRNR